MTADEITFHPLPLDKMAFNNVTYTGKFEYYDLFVTCRSTKYFFFIFYKINKFIVHGTSIEVKTNRLTKYQKWLKLKRLRRDITQKK